MNLRLTSALLALWLLAGSCPAAPAPALVSASFQPRADSLGFNWDLDSYGNVQSGSNCFSGAMQMEVNGSSFSPQQAMMTADGSEYFFDANVNNAVVNRRVKIEQKAAFIRYFDTVRNTSATPQKLRFSLRIQMNNQMQPALGDSGAPLAAGLGPKDNGVAFFPQPGSSGPSALILISSRGAKVRPTVQNQQNQRLNITYNLNLAPGESISLVHAMAQRTINATPDAKALAKLFAPLNSPRLFADVPPPIRKTLVNFVPSAFTAGPTAPALSSLLENLNVERGPSDILAIGAETRLKGTASCTRLEIDSPRGKTVVPLEQVAALVGNRGEARVLLRDGQALSGKLTAQGLKFALPTGTTISLDATVLDRLVLRAELSDTLVAAGVWGFVESINGERLAVKFDPAQRLRATTAWGLREIAFDDLLGCAPDEDNPLGFRVVLKDGSTFMAFLDGDEIPFETFLFGKQLFRTSELRQIAATPPKPVEEAAEMPPARAQVGLAGGQLVAGQIDLAELHFLSPAGVLPVVANLLRSLQNTSADESEDLPTFTGLLWGGGAVAGTLREVMVPVRTGNTVFQVPVRDLVSAVVPSPVMPEGLRDRIAALLRDLGHADWEKREGASRELGDLGAMARGPVEEAVKQTTDAEVRRRAQTLLDAMETL